MGLTVAHCNCRGLKEKLALGLVDLDAFDILCVQETLLKNHSNLACRGFTAVKMDISGAGSSDICTLVKNNLEFAIIDMEEAAHPSLEIQGITVNIKNKPTLIVNIYRHPHRITPVAAWDRIFKLHESYPNMMIVGDFNAHHNLWYNLYSDAAGNSLATASYNSDFIILNEDRQTMVPHPLQRISIIDLS